MMWLRRNLPLLVGGLIFAGLVAWTVMLFRETKSTQSEVETKHHDLEQKLDRLMKMPIFPSRENIEQLQAQTQLLHSYYADLVDRFPRHAKEYPTMTRWDFRAYIGTRLDKLRQECVVSNRVQVATDFSFGFGRYLGNTLVKEDDTPKLLHQMDLVESLVRLLGKSKVAGISGIRRTFLEGETDGAAERVDGGTWNTDPNSIYESQTFEVAFRCGSEQVKAVLNNFARTTNLVIIVRNISIEADKASPRESQGGSTPPAGGTPTAPNPMVMPGFPQPPVGGRGVVAPTGRGQPATATTDSGELPLVMGNEMSSVVLRLDVLEMKPTEAEKEKAATSPKEAPAKKSRG